MNYINQGKSFGNSLIVEHEYLHCLNYGLLLVSKYPWGSYIRRSLNDRKFIEIKLGLLTMVSICLVVLLKEPLYARYGGMEDVTETVEM